MFQCPGEVISAYLNFISWVTFFFLIKEKLKNHDSIKKDGFFLTVEIKKHFRSFDTEKC